MSLDTRMVHTVHGSQQVPPNMTGFGRNDISQAHMTDPLSRRNIDNQKSNVTFVPAVHQSDQLGFKEEVRTQ